MSDVIHNPIHGIHNPNLKINGVTSLAETQTMQAHVTETY